MSVGRVVWITGLPGVGKTSIGAALLGRLRQSGIQTVQLDGDEMRRVLWPDAGYDEATRRELASAYARLAVSVARQDTIVIVTAVALFAEVRGWLAAHAPAYLEVLVQCPEAQRVGRVPTMGRRGPEVGRELPAELPLRPDLVIDNRGGPESIAAHARQIAACLHERQTV
ncbi:MAG: adenylyl-sulfate kinase [Rhodocyclaceae bacterium]|nr:adenylyl-sulfate kinase [Rhodocyclaceae bacterium]